MDAIRINKGLALTWINSPPSNINLPVRSCLHVPSGWTTLAIITDLSGSAIYQLVSRVTLANLMASGEYNVMPWTLESDGRNRTETATLLAGIRDEVKYGDMP